MAAIPQLPDGIWRYPRFPAGFSRNIWDDLINRYGEPALLRQNGIADRWVIHILGQFTSIERMGGISNPADLKAIISTLSPETGGVLAPNPSERDTLVTLKFDEQDEPVLDADGAPTINQILKIVAPPTPIGTRALSRQLYWRLQCRK